MKSSKFKFFVKFSIFAFLFTFSRILFASDYNNEIALQIKMFAYSLTSKSPSNQRKLDYEQMLFKVQADLGDASVINSIVIDCANSNPAPDKITVRIDLSTGSRFRQQNQAPSEKILNINLPATSLCKNSATFCLPMGLDNIPRVNCSQQSRMLSFLKTEIRDRKFLNSHEGMKANIPSAAN